MKEFKDLEIQKNYPTPKILDLGFEEVEIGENTILETKPWKVRVGQRDKWKTVKIVKNGAEILKDKKRLSP